MVLRNYEGYITTYTEPEDYNPHAVAPLEEKVLRRPEPGQAGVLGLLQGEDLFIKPAQFDEVHTRGGGMHRLKADETKWQPLGIGSAPRSDRGPEQRTARAAPREACRQTETRAIRVRAILNRRILIARTPDASTQPMTVYVMGFVVCKIVDREARVVDDSRCQPIVGDFL